MEDGTSVITDSQGRWHIEGVEPGTHVLQIDLDSLPNSHRVIACETNTRFAGTPFSQFVDVQGGSLWRADFHVAVKPPVEEEIETRLRARLDGDRVHFQLDAAGRAVPLTGLTLVTMLPDGLVYEAGSLRQGDTVLADPAGAESGAVTLRLGDRSGVWSDQLTFTGQLTSALAEGDAQARMVAMFATPSARRVRSPVATAAFSVAPAAPAPDGLAQVIELSRHDAWAQVDAALLAAKRAGQTLEFAVDGDPPPWLIDRALAADVELRTTAAAAAAEDSGAAQAVKLAIGSASGTGLTLSTGPTLSTGAPEPVVPPATAIPADAGPAEQLTLTLGTPLIAGRVSVSNGDSGVQHTRAVGAPTALEDAAGTYTPRPLPEHRPPEYSTATVGTLADGPAILYPPEGQLPRITSSDFVIRAGLNDRVELRLNGEPVSPLNYEGRTKYKSAGVALMRWRGVSIQTGRNLVEATITQADGGIVTLARDLLFTGAPVRAEYLPEASRLIADGVQVPEIALRLFEASGSPVRGGTAVAFTIEAPYAPYRDRRVAADLSGASQAGRQMMTVHDDGIAYIPLEPTAVAGRVRLSVEFENGARKEEFIARLLPGERDWVIVGFGAGSVGYRTLSDNMIAAEDAGYEEGLDSDSRVSLYAKGMIQGKYLLTLAYDSDKRDTGRFGQQVDPNRFYTLYGDGSQQQFEAASQEKLYLRIERGTFGVLFGDVDTNLGRAELTRFSRRLTGLRSEWSNEAWDVIVFGAETDTAFVRDELRGNGTSGLYRLSGRDILDNSERIRIETRDRFDDAVIVESRSLARFVDYNIDYDLGTVLFKAPVAIQDAELNPTFIVAEYETEGGSDGRTDIVAGGRVERRIGNAEVGASYVTDGTRGAEAQLGGVDARWRPDSNTEVRAEAGWTRGEGGDGDTESGAAWLIEAERRGEQVTSRGYYREQQADFGVGQQSVSQGGTRRFGLELEVRFGGNGSVNSAAYQQRNLETGAQRNVLEAEARWGRGDTQLGAGVRSAQESAPGQNDIETNQLTVRGEQAFFGNRLTLGMTGEQALGGTNSRDFPTRVGLSAELRALSRLTLIGTQELTFADERDTQDTYFGARAEPWKGGSLDAGVVRQLAGENPERMFATVGLAQAFKLTEQFSVDFGFNREQTLEDGLAAPTPVPQLNDRDSDNSDGDLLVQDPEGAFPARPPASGAARNSDSNSGYIGAAYNEEFWQATARMELRQAGDTDQSNLRLGFARQLDVARIFTVTSNVLRSRTSSSEDLSGDVRLALAWRPDGGAWTFLDRLDLVFSERTGQQIDIAERKLVNNFAANFKPNARNQLSLLVGTKYLLGEIDSQTYSSFTTLFGSEYRHDVTARWDLGLHGSVLSSWSSSVHDVQAGLSIGHTPFDNFWISLGYNFVGFTDDDFTAADFTAQGPFVKFRFKLDQESLAEYLGEMPFTLD